MSRSLTALLSEELFLYLFNMNKRCSFSSLIWYQWNICIELLSRTFLCHCATPVCSYSSIWNLFLLVKKNSTCSFPFCMCQLLLYSVRMKRLREIHEKTEVYKSFDQPGDAGSSTPLLHPEQLEPGGVKGSDAQGESKKWTFQFMPSWLFTYRTCLEGLPPDCSLILRLQLKPVFLLLWGDGGYTAVTASLSLAQAYQTSARPLNLGLTQVRPQPNHAVCFHSLVCMVLSQEFLLACSPLPIKGLFLFDFEMPADPRSGTFSLMQ